MNAFNTLPRGMFPTLVSTLGAHEDESRIAALQTNLANAIDDCAAAHELIDAQRAQIAGLNDALSIEGQFADYYRDEAIQNAAHLAVIDDLLERVGLPGAPTIERVNALISLWLAAEARAQGLSTISDHPTL